MVNEDYIQLSEAAKVLYARDESSLLLEWGSPSRFGQYGKLQDFLVFDKDACSYVLLNTDGILKLVAELEDALSEKGITLGYKYFASMELAYHKQPSPNELTFTLEQVYMNRSEVQALKKFLVKDPTCHERYILPTNTLQFVDKTQTVIYYGRKLKVSSPRGYYLIKSMYGEFVNLGKSIFTRQEVITLISLVEEGVNSPPYPVRGCGNLREYKFKDTFPEGCPVRSSVPELGLNPLIDIKKQEKSNLLIFNIDNHSEIKTFDDFT